MSKLVWDGIGDKRYENGNDHAVVYPQDNHGHYPKGYAWNGITGFSESPDGADANDLWADNIKYGSLRAAENYGFSIEAYQYPPEFGECDGSYEAAPGVYISQQKRKPFGFSIRTNIGNDTMDEADDGYKLHLIYNATASPSEKSYETINDSPDAITFSWDCDTIPINVTGYKPTACLTIDSTRANATKLAALEDILYGTDAQDAVATTYKAAPSTYDSSLRYFTRTGEGTELSPYVYTEVTISEYEVGVEYFVIDVEGHDAVLATDPRLPLPDEVIAMLAA